MRTVAIVLIFAILAFILTLIAIMLAHWKRFRYETDRYLAWQSVFGKRGAKVVLIGAFIALAMLVGLFMAFPSIPQ